MKLPVWITALFGKKTKPTPKSQWNKFDESNPPEDAVLAACYTYDCGWVIDSVWYDKKEKWWYVTGSVEKTEAHLPYSHWRELPEPPESMQ